MSTSLGDFTVSRQVNHPFVVISTQQKCTAGTEFETTWAILLQIICWQSEPILLFSQSEVLALLLCLIATFRKTESSQEMELSGKLHSAL
jgi:uncharacterized membrane protein